MSRRNPRFSKSEPFVKLSRWVLNTAAWRDLDTNARQLYVELRARFNGVNNGMIGLGCREAALALNVSRNTANRAFGHLEDHGFIKPASPASFNTHGRRATEWLLTEERDDRTGHLASKDFAKWGQQKLDRRISGGTHGHSGGTQTNPSANNSALRPMAVTQTAETPFLASHESDTYRSTTPPAAATAQPAKEASPHKAGARRSGQAREPVQVSDALAKTKLVASLTKGVH